MTVEQFPQKQVSDYTSLMSLLRCDDCHKEWIALYATGTKMCDLYCIWCNSFNITNRQGEREVVFYDYREQTEQPMEER